MRIGEPVGRFEAEIERIGGARRCIRFERHRDRGAVGRRLRGERQIAREAVHRQIAHDAGRIAPAAQFTVDAMAAEEREQQRIAAAHARELAPVGGVGPEDDGLAVKLPRQQAAAELRCDADDGWTGMKFVNLVLLEDGHGGSKWTNERTPRRRVTLSGARATGKTLLGEIASFSQSPVSG